MQKNAKTTQPKKVDLVVESDELNPEDKYKIVLINGKRIQIKKDEEVEVSPIVKDILRESRDFNRKGNKPEKLILG
jgi:hypothetical protein